MKMTKTQENLAALIKENLGKGYLWAKGWKGGAPVNSAGKRYKGINNLYLTLVAMKRGYKSSKWYTFNAMKKAGLNFKTLEGGATAGKGAGVPVEYWNQYDKKTKAMFDESVLDGMTKDEKRDYMKENVHLFGKTAIVFNADLIEGLDEPEIKGETCAAAEKFLSDWSQGEVKIIHNGDECCYRLDDSAILLPPVENFKTYDAYYQSALHEVAHSTGYKTRLNRDMTRANYAKEELVAEISSLFLCQRFGVDFDGDIVRNSAAYLDAWKERIEENENAIDEAVKEAAKVDEYIEKWTTAEKAAA